MAIAAAVSVGIILTLAALALVALVRSSLERPIAGEARVRAADVVALAHGGDLPAIIPPVAAPWPTLVQVLDARGRVIAASRELVGRPPLLAPSPAAKEPTGSASLTYAGRTESFRLDAVVASTSSAVVTVVVATSLAQAERSARLVATALAIGVPLVTLAAALLGWLLAGRALRPVEELRAEVAKMDGRSRDQRVVVPGGDDELGRLAGTLNAMLGRVAAANAQQSRLVADVSHELRSPLAAIRLATEVALAYPDQRPWPEVAAEVRSANDRMARMVEDLLTLARAEAGQLPSGDALVEFDAVVADVADTTPPSPGVMVRLASLESVVVHGDELQLRRVVQNLVENAIRHAASTVTVSVKHQAGQAVLTVIDDGPGVPIGERDRVFERFVRLEDDRSRPGAQTDGAGLGLAIVADLVRLHGGTVGVGGSRGAVFTVRLPAVPGGLPENRTGSQSPLRNVQA